MYWVPCIPSGGCSALRSPTACSGYERASAPRLDHFPKPSCHLESFPTCFCSDYVVHIQPDVHLRCWPHQTWVVLLLKGVLLTEREVINSNLPRETLFTHGTALAGWVTLQALLWDLLLQPLLSGFGIFSRAFVWFLRMFCWETKTGEASLPPPPP